MRKHRSSALTASDGNRLVDVVIINRTLTGTIEKAETLSSEEEVILRPAIETHNGFVFKTVGDGNKAQYNGLLLGSAPVDARIDGRQRAFSHPVKLICLQLAEFLP